MIPRTELSVQSLNWQQELSQAVVDPGELLNLLKLDPDQLDAATRASLDFPLRVPRSYVARMRQGDAADPLLLQALPQAQELIDVEGFSSDPLEEHDTPLPGLIHKYPGRVLVMLSGLCAINCRYCFRRHFPYSQNQPNKQQWAEVLDYIRADPSINEVILSGGDPLAMSDQRLAWLSEQLDAIPQLKRLRIHTRLPIVIAQRVDEALLGWLSRSRLHCIMVVHSNHPHEIDSQVSEAFDKLHRAGISLLNQSVMLKDINDNSAVLIELSERLFAAHVQPYYIHQLDPVAGAAHFAVSDEVALEIMQTMRDSCSAYLIPTLAREEPGAQSKTVLS